VADVDEVELGLAIAREALLPPAGAQERVLAHVARRRAFGARAARGPVASAAKKLITTTVLLGTGFVAGYWLGRHESDVAPGGALAAASPVAGEAATPVAPQPVASAASQPPSSTIPAPAPSLPPAELAQSPGRAARAASAALPPPRDPSRAAESQPVPAARGSAVLARRARPAAPPTDELTLLSRVERALRAGEAALALALLDELDHHHPRSTLAEERIAARLLADCMREAPLAAARAQQFLQQHHDSVYSDRLRSTCALAASDDGTPAANEGGAEER
jgi:hypothetical protein